MKKFALVSAIWLVTFIVISGTEGKKPRRKDDDDGPVSHEKMNRADVHIAETKWKLAMLGLDKHGRSHNPAPQSHHGHTGQSDSKHYKRIPKHPSEETIVYDEEDEESDSSED